MEIRKRTTPRVFLTGASGTVGSGILEVLVSSGEYEVFGLARTRASAAEIERRGGHALPGDMGDAAFLDRLGAHRAYDFIIHAAQAHYHHHARAEIDDLERRAVRNLEKLRDDSTRLMIFTGGVWSYGTGAGGNLISEATPFRPFKAAEKRAALLRELAHRREHPWTQFFPPSMVYGSTGPLPDIARTFRAGGTVEVLDDDTVLWSVIERLDLGRAYLALLRHGKAGDHFVVAEDKPVRVVDFYATIAARIGRGTVVRKPLAAMAAAMSDDMLEVIQTNQPVDASRFKERTGWRAQESFATSVQRFLGDV